MKSLEDELREIVDKVVRYAPRSADPPALLPPNPFEEISGQAPSRLLLGPIGDSDASD